MSVRRSPVSTPTSSMEHTQSESDINALQLSDVSFVNVNSNKRFRTNQPSPPETEQNLNQDIMAMLNTWKAEFEIKIDDMYNSQNILITKLSSDIRDLKAQNVKIQKSNDDIVQSMSFINKQYQEVKAGLDTLQKERLEQKRCIENLERKIQDLQLRTRSSNVEIRNIPLIDKETVANLKDTICKIGQVIGTPISSPDLRDIYRLPGKPGTVRLIVAEFQTVQLKLDMITAIREYNRGKKTEEKLNTEVIKIPGRRQAVYVSDYLPASSKKLFHQAREFANHNNFKYCWTSNSNIFLRKAEGEKQILITSEKCLLDFRKNM